MAQTAEAPRHDRGALIIIRFEWWDQETGVFLECAVHFRPETLDALRGCAQTRNIVVTDGNPWEASAGKR